MVISFKYKKVFLIITYGLLLQFFILSFFEFSTISDKAYLQYFTYKGVVLVSYLFFIICLHFKKLTPYWTYFFNINFFLNVLIGEYFSPGHHYILIQFIFISTIVFDGFPKVPTLLLVLYLIEYSVLSSSLSYLDINVYIALSFSWFSSIALERFVNRLKNKTSLLDRKLRYKGIKTDLFLHDLKNKLQPIVSGHSDYKDFKKIIKMVQGFNSFNDEVEIFFSDVVVSSQEKMSIDAEIIFSGSEDFFIDQMDLQTILCNLMKNSQKAAEFKNVSLIVKIKNKSKGFTYEDNAGGMSDEQYKFFSQKEIRPYVGHEKNGLGLLLIKKLVECHEGKFIIKKIPNGTRFEINY